MRFYKVLYIFLLSVLIVACSTNRNTGLSRAFQNMTAHYNVYFNGNESYKEGTRKVRDKVRNDYSQILPVFEYSDKENVSSASSDMDRAIQKGIKLIQKHSITKKPKKKASDGDEAYKKFYNQKEFNKWVDDAYLLIGKAQFYKHEFNQAIMTFDMLIRDYPETPSFYEAKIWKAAAYSEKEDYINAKVALESYDMTGTAPYRLYGKYMAVQADLLLKQEEYKEAIPYLISAVDEAPDKWSKQRFQFILAQVYEETGMHKEAVDAYNQVLKLRPPYEMAFNAEVGRVAIVFDGASTDNIKKEIRRLLRDKKNRDYRDRIYYALANVNMSEGDEQEAVKNLKLSTKYSVDNEKQKALSFIRLGDIYFERPEYEPAYKAYDSAIVFIPKTDERYLQLSEKYQSLKLLVNNIEIVAHEDSLQALAQMSEPVRLATLQQYIEDERKRAEDEEKRKREMEENGFYDSMGLNAMANMRGAGGKWYFYNANSINMGKMEFQKRWGRRALEDNWRRSDKSSTAPSDDEIPGLPGEDDELGIGENGDAGGEAGDGEEDDNAMTIESLLKDIPLTDSAMAVSNKRIESALLEMGMIYRDRLYDYPKATETFEELLGRFSEGNRREDAFIESYQVYYFSGDELGMDQIKQRITEEFPDSKFTAFLNDPEFFEKIEKIRIEQEALYEQAYVNYLNGLYLQVINRSDSAILVLENDDELLPKYRLLKSLSFARQGESVPFRAGLDEIVTLHKGTEEAKLAEGFIVELEAGRMPVKSAAYQSELFQAPSEYTISSSELGDGKVTGQVFEPKAKHSLVVVVNAEADMKRLIFNFADYNFGRFLLNDYGLLSHTLPDGSNVLEIKGFNNKREALDYFYSVRQTPLLFNVDNIKNTRLFSVSDKNLSYLLSSGDMRGCILFFIQNYLSVSAANNQMIEEDEEYSLSYVQPVVAKIEDLEAIDNSNGLDNSQPVGYQENSAPFSFVISFDASRVNHNRLKSMFVGFNRNKRIAPAPEVKIVDLSDKRKMLVVSAFDSDEEALDYLNLVKENPFTLRDISRKKYELFIIGENNFEQLKKDQSVDEYLQKHNTNQ